MERLTTCTHAFYPKAMQDRTNANAEPGGGINMEITYEQAVKNISDYMDMAGNKFSAFDGSTALALIFKLPKEKTLKDIIQYRTGKLG